MQSCCQIGWTNNKLNLTFKMKVIPKSDHPLTLHLSFFHTECNPPCRVLMLPDRSLELELPAKPAGDLTLSAWARRDKNCSFNGPSTRIFSWTYGELYKWHIGWGLLNNTLVSDDLPGKGFQGTARIVDYNMWVAPNYPLRFSFCSFVNWLKVR